MDEIRDEIISDSSCCSDGCIGGMLQLVLAAINNIKTSINNCLFRREEKFLLLEFQKRGIQIQAWDLPSMYNSRGPHGAEMKYSFRKSTRS